MQKSFKSAKTGNFLTSSVQAHKHSLDTLAWQASSPYCRYISRQGNSGHLPLYLTRCHTAVTVKLISNSNNCFTAIFPGQSKPVLENDPTHQPKLSPLSHSLTSALSSSKRIARTNIA